ncbi:unnamed protein product, partial [Mesorhabditis belari]|uniref:Transthyretin-like family protein n=1 Tax=Mesorhabditis belari TaxID=2138241 RepID=A0AAF3J5E7_9BILA
MRIQFFIVAFLLAVQPVTTSNQAIRIAGKLLCSGKSITGRVHLKSGSNFLTRGTLKDVRTEPDGRFELSWSSRWFNWPVAEPKLSIYTDCVVKECRRESKFPLSESNFTSGTEAQLIDLGDIEIRALRWVRYCNYEKGDLT